MNSRRKNPKLRLVVVDNAAVLHSVRTRYKRSDIYTFATASVELWCIVTHQSDPIFVRFCECRGLKPKPLNLKP